MIDFGKLVKNSSSDAKSDSNLSTNKSRLDRYSEGKSYEQELDYIINNSSSPNKPRLAQADYNVSGFDPMKPKDVNVSQMDTINHLELLLMNSDDGRSKNSLYKPANRFGRQLDDRGSGSKADWGQTSDPFKPADFTRLKPTTIQSGITPSQSTVSPAFSEVMTNNFDNPRGFGSTQPVQGYPQADQTLQQKPATAASPNYANQQFGQTHPVFRMPASFDSMNEPANLRSPSPSIDRTQLNNPPQPRPNPQPTPQVQAQPQFQAQPFQPQPLRSQSPQFSQTPDQQKPAPVERERHATPPPSFANSSMMNSAQTPPAQQRNQSPPPAQAQPVAVQPAAPLNGRHSKAFPNGSMYSGDFVQGKRHGTGRQQWADGSSYDGQWREDAISGKGRLTHGNGDVYEGDWLNNCAHGKGRFVRFEGGEFVGDWEQDRQQGSGVEVTPDGDRYEGQFRAGKKEGAGKYRWANGCSYEGAWANNKLNGEGKFVWPDGRMFAGRFLNNKMHGPGHFVWPDGSYYKGEYSFDKKHGQGEMGFADRKVYRGGWSMGLMHGEGTVLLPNGSAKKGQWSNGRRVKWLEG